MRSFIIALLCLPFCAFAQDSLNVSSLSRIGLGHGPELGRVSLHGDYLMATEPWWGLHIVDISDPESPFEVAAWETDSMISDVVAIGYYAYVSEYGGDLHILDISNPVEPVEISIVENIGGRQMRLHGTYGFATASGLNIIDFSDALNPQVVGVYDPPGDSWGSNVADVAVNGDIAYVSCSDSGVRIVDISDVTAPIEIGVYPVEGAASDVTMSGNRMYVSEYVGERPDTVEIVDVSDPAAPVKIGALYEADVLHTDLVAVGDYVFTSAKAAEGFRLYNASDPENVELIGYHDLYWYCHQLLVEGNLVYINDQFGVQILDVSEALPFDQIDPPVISQFSLHPIYPNPFNNTATIAFDLPREVTGRLVVFDVLGREISTLYNGRLASGKHSMQFEGENLSSGTYLIRLETASEFATQKAVLLK